MIDNILIHLLSTRYISEAQQSTQLIEANCAITAIVLSDWIYLVAVIMMNSIISLVHIFESIRTRVWSGISTLDLVNLEDIIISTIKGMEGGLQSTATWLVFAKPNRKDGSGRLDSTRIGSYAAASQSLALWLGRISRHASAHLPAELKVAGQADDHMAVLSNVLLLKEFTMNDLHV